MELPSGARPPQPPQSPQSPHPLLSTPPPQRTQPTFPGVTQPFLSGSSSAASSSGATAAAVTNRLKELRSEELLALLLAPDLDDSLSPGAILGANNVALFNLMPLILAAIHRVGATITRRDRFVRLVSVLRARITACRGLKLRFLLLVNNPGYSIHWVVRMVHRKDCYIAARHILGTLEQDDTTQDESGKSFQLARQLSKVDKADSKSVAGWLNDKDMLIAFAARKLLHHEHGIRRRTIKWHMRTVKNAFYSHELIDGIMERANFSTRQEAVALAQRMLDMGLIHKIGSSTQHIADGKKRVFQCRIAISRDDDGHCRVVTASGKVLDSWDVVKSNQCSKITQIEILIPVDMIDLQGYEFWTTSVYIKGAEKGHHFGYRAITHPLHCEGMETKNQVDDMEKQALRDFDSLDAGSENGSDFGSFSSLNVAVDDINQLQHDAAVVGSAVVRKVFSSIARPMIVELRVPMENADLNKDKHHLVLPPGVLVKEGDNLMQDLGVEIMFQCFNHVWAHSDVFARTESEIPFSFPYQVFPTSTTQGFMEAVTGLTSLKEYDWEQWKNQYGRRRGRVNEMLRSTVGAYVGTYVCGGRDRHFDNVLIKDDKHLLHIDFGFLMGTSPPIDGPRIAIAPQMEAVFQELKVWDRFVEMFVHAFLALRRSAPAIIRTSVMVFSKAGYEEDQIRTYLQGRYSLNVHEKEHKAADFVRRQLVSSSGDIKTRFKAFAHEHIDPAWYGLLDKGFAPAVAIMKMVDAKEQKATKKLEMSSELAPEVSEEEKLQL